MARAGGKPLNLQDILLTGKAVEGFVEMRLIDGEKVASKRLNLVEVMQMKQWLTKFIENHRYLNRLPTNIDHVGIDQKRHKRSAHQVSLSSEEISLIQQRYENGDGVKKLADEFEVDQSTIIRALEQ